MRLQTQSLHLGYGQQTHLLGAARTTAVSLVPCPRSLTKGRATLIRSTGSASGTKVVEGQNHPGSFEPTQDSFPLLPSALAASSTVEALSVEQAGQGISYGQLLQCQSQLQALQGHAHPTGCLLQKRGFLIAKSPRLGGPYSQSPPSLAIHPNGSAQHRAVAQDAGQFAHGISGYAADVRLHDHPLFANCLTDDE